MRTRVAFLLAAALAAFGGSLASGFHFDDYAIFQGVFSGAPGDSLLWCLRQTRPLTYLTFWLNYQVGGANPLGYHALNLALHIAAVWLLYEALKRWIPAEAAFAAAALFAVHPIQAESVDYIWGRSIVLAAVFCFASLIAWGRGREWTAVAWFFAALLAKEECAAFPLALMAIESARRMKPQHYAMLLLAVLAGARVIYATAVTPGAPAGFQAGITPWNYFLAQGPVIWRYLRLLILPVGFTVDPQISAPPVWLGLAAWAAIAAIAWRWRWMRIGFLLLLPSSSIFPAQDLSADRRMYLPMAAFAVAAALAISKQHLRRSAAVLVIVFGAFSIGRTYVWMSDERLWREAVAHAPEKLRPMIQLSRSVPPAEALELLHRARALAPGDAGVAAETGKVLLAQGNAAEALNQFGRALALDPDNAQNFNNRGAAFQALGLTDAARQDYQHALALDPSLEQARRNLMMLAR